MSFSFLINSVNHLVEPHLRSKLSHAAGLRCTSRCAASLCSVSKTIENGLKTFIFTMRGHFSYRVHLSQHRPVCEEQRLPGVHNNEVKEGAPGLLGASRLQWRIILNPAEFFPTNLTTTNTVLPVCNLQAGTSWSPEGRGGDTLEKVEKLQFEQWSGKVHLGVFVVTVSGNKNLCHLFNSGQQNGDIWL